MQITDQERAQYKEQGYLIFRDALVADDFKRFDDAFVSVTERCSGRRFASMHDPELVRFFAENLEIESEIYNAVRAAPEMRELATSPKLTSLLDEIDKAKWGLLEKMILRIDLPNMEKEVAHWHQDYFYVKGNELTVTLWIPLQKTTLENGCLLVQPGSHKQGVVAHDHQIGKRHIPSESILQNSETISVPMEFGDVLIFHALLLHSGQLNTSASTRYSFQFRYSPEGLPTDPGMGRLLPLPNADAARTL